MERHSIQFGTRTLVFELIFKERKSLGISVYPDKRIVVKAPLNASLDQIHQKVRKRAPWIVRQQSYFLSFEPLTPPRQFVSGESHLYLGKRYRLKVHDARFDEIKLSRGVLEVYSTDPAGLKRQMQQWYMDKARLHFPAIAAKWTDRFRKYGVAPEKTEIKWMEKRWGSCTPKGKIILNAELIKAPKGCIEYVVAHELCHLMHHNHSSAFLALQTKEMPDWVLWKDRLERVMA